MILNDTIRRTLKKQAQAARNGTKPSGATIQQKITSSLKVFIMSPKYIAESSHIN